jgi:hypothetical protein
MIGGLAEMDLLRNVRTYSIPLETAVFVTLTFNPPPTQLQARAFATCVSVAFQAIS